MKLYGYMIASNHVALDGQRVGWMYREEPTDDNDSGWRVFSGNEGEAFEEAPSNFGIYDATTIIAIDPEIVEFLDLGIGAEVERGAHGEFTVSHYGTNPKEYG